MRSLKDISISKKLYFVVVTMAILILFELATLWFAIHTLSSVRALVGAEGLWSKAQKDGVYQLVKYSQTLDERDYDRFIQYMGVPLGDHKTRLELLKAKPDMAIASAGFLEGRIHADDIDGMIKLLRRFHDIYYIKKAISIWSQGDSMILRLMMVGTRFHAGVLAGKLTSQNSKELFDQIDPLNIQLTSLEDNFSYTLGEGSRWLEYVILSLLFGVALTVEITGLMLSISITRSITMGLKAIITAANKIARGNLSERAKVYSKDEIGRVAIAVNRMTAQLTFSNNELSQFAQVASHDLQEPLRTVSNYSNLLQDKYRGKLDDSADKYLDSMGRAIRRMQQLIRDILAYSTIGHDSKTKLINCNTILEEVTNDMRALIAESDATIAWESLPVVSAHNELSLLFQNLISNAIKFRKPDTRLCVNISAAEEQDNWLFRVVDNGIGIEKKYFDKIFVIFQKLHSYKDYPGTGIGLAQCKKIVELHHGTIRVDSEPGKGSTFYFTLPKNIRA